VPAVMRSTRWVLRENGGGCNETVCGSLSFDPIVLVPTDSCFLGMSPKSFFTSQVGDMLGEIQAASSGGLFYYSSAGVIIS